LQFKVLRKFVLANVFWIKNNNYNYLKNNQLIKKAKVLSDENIRLFFVGHHFSEALVL